MIDKREIQHLRTLEVLFACATLGEAAERLNMSQQAVSARLQKIRTILGDELFLRDGHGMQSTAYAMQIKPMLENVLSQLNAIPAAADFRQMTNFADLHREIVICATDYTQQLLLTPLLAKLRTLAPAVKVAVGNIEVAELSAKMRSGSVFLALTTSGYVPEGLTSVPLMTEQYRCVSAHPDLTVDEPVTPLTPVLPETLARYDFVVVNPLHSGFTGSADGWFARLGETRNVVISVPGFGMAIQMLQQSHLVGLLPSRLLPVPGLKDIPLTQYPPGFEVVAVHHASMTNDPLLIWFLQNLQTLAQSLPHSLEPVQPPA